ncbi:hypothetical protein [Lacrimispora sp.]|uniref:hypothetical protein n=1 Tax=Lacrimispora sp. TaxID=2719234 RepID=UPI0028AC8769|nr:hypothetical protein [Lacrimispora sp.]
MKIYVNEQYEVLSLDDKPQEYSEVFEVSQTREEMFGNFCAACTQGYKYEPQYELLFNEDGSNARDEKTGELLYKLDDNGEKICQGYVCYPFVDYRTLLLIQKQYEDSQQRVQVLNAQVEYLSMMSGYEMEV